ncbi:hypothetical protein B0H34DRAFT_189754 [Crassisporium funariophilum]|nr:hypothetical protein B0H34DRAFT_189754 [Crassisporium funariophilum]
MVVLPFELERKIFEVAVLLHPECALQLVLVAHYIREWVEPEIYRVLRTGGGRVIPPIYQGDYKDENYPHRPKELDVPRLQRFGPHVRHAMLQDCSLREIIVVLQHCTNLKNVAIWGSYDRSEALAQSVIASLEALPYLRKLSIQPQDFFPDDDLPFPFDIPMFRNITHLDIITFTNLSQWWSKISSLRKLSHLSMTPNFATGFVDAILSACPSLQKLMFMGGSHYAKVLPHSDKRLIYVDFLSDLGLWEESVRNGEDYWITAEKTRYTPAFVNVA